MSKKSKSSKPSGSLNVYPLWMWGALLIVAGVASNFVVAQVMPAPAGIAEARGQALGRGLVTVVAVIAGIIMIIRDVTRRK